MRACRSLSAHSLSLLVSPVPQVSDVWHCAPTDPRVGLLGAMQSLFEGSMYTFVFLWTPALSPDGEHLPHGMIFACFMVSSMAGSALAGRLLAHGSG